MKRIVRCALALVVAGMVAQSIQAVDNTPPATVYATLDNVPLKLFVFTPEQSATSPRAAILLFHSGDWVRGKPDALILFYGDVDIENSELFCTLIKQAGGYCRLHVFPGLGHLLTRKLDDQKTSIDADPEAVVAARRLQELFLQDTGFIVGA
jgi:acetyl esterase/lipase